MVFKLYGHPKSTCSQRVALVLKEKNVPYEYVPVSLETGEHKKEEFKAINPFGQIPYIVCAPSTHCPSRHSHSRVNNILFLRCRMMMA